MKNHFSAVSKLVAAAICALSLGSCSRAEYAMLPKGGSYHGIARAATPVPAAPLATTAAPATTPLAETVAAPAAVVATVLPPAVVAAAPATSKALAAPAAAPPALATTSAAAPKLNLVQRIALSKVARKLDKLAQKSGSVRQHDNTASTARGSISGNLRIGIILLLVGLLVGFLNGFVGGIIAIIGLIFIILWLLDQA